MEWYYYALIFLIGFVPVTWYFFKLGAFSYTEPEAVTDVETPPMEVDLHKVKSITINFQ